MLSPGKFGLTSGSWVAQRLAGIGLSGRDAARGVCLRVAARPSAAPVVPAHMSTPEHNWSRPTCQRPAWSTAEEFTGPRLVLEAACFRSRACVYCIPTNNPYWLNSFFFLCTTQEDRTVCSGTPWDFFFKIRISEAPTKRPFSQVLLLRFNVRFQDAPCQR